MNEIEFAESLWSLINSAMNDGPEMVAHTATSFADDTLIENCEQYGHLDEQRLEFTTRRGDVFLVTVERVRAGVPV